MKKRRRKEEGEQETLQELIEEIEDTCGTLAISHDSPDMEMIKEWFVRHEQIKSNQIRRMESDGLCVLCGEKIQSGDLLKLHYQRCHPIISITDVNEYPISNYKYLDI